MVGGGAAVMEMVGRIGKKWQLFSKEATIKILKKG